MCLCGLGLGWKPPGKRKVEWGIKGSLHAVPYNWILFKLASPPPEKTGPVTVFASTPANTHASTPCLKWPLFETCLRT